MKNINLPNSLVAAARQKSKVSKRSTSAQIEDWATIGKVVEDNPDLTYGFIKDILKGQKQALAGKTTPYRFDK